MFNVKILSKMEKEEREKLDEILHLAKLNAKAIRLLLLIAIGQPYRYQNWEIRVNEYYERMFRSFCKRYGYKCCIRSKRTEAAGTQPQWRKADSLTQRRKAIHDRLVASAFDLSIRTSTTEGGLA